MVVSLFGDLPDRADPAHPGVVDQDVQPAQPPDCLVDGLTDGVALGLFWAKGYDGTTMADLSSAMNLKPGSIYAAFGSKEGLYEKVLDRYVTTVFTYSDDAVARPTVRDVVEAWLRGAATVTTGEGTTDRCPRGSSRGSWPHTSPRSPRESPSRRRPELRAPTSTR
nr:TetR/AcrR family transcriptional regulator [Planotetraspora mira]